MDPRTFPSTSRSPDVMISPMMLKFAPILEYAEDPVSNRRRVLQFG
jgi:hypothetical protein